MLRPGGVCTMFIHLHGESEAGNFSQELLPCLEDILGWPQRPAQCSFVGGRLKRVGHWMLARLDFSYTTLGLWALPFTLPLAAAWLPLMVLENLHLRLLLPSRHFVPNCSSLSIRLTPTEEKGAASERSDSRRPEIQRVAASAEAERPYNLTSPSPPTTRVSGQSTTK